MGETFISLDPDGQFWKKIDGCKADKQTKKSRALFLARGLKSVQCSTGVPEEMSRTVYYSVDTGGRYSCG